MNRVTSETQFSGDTGSRPVPRMATSIHLKGIGFPSWLPLLFLILFPLFQRTVPASVPYEVYSRDIDMGFPQPYPDRESFEVGGFMLTINLNKMGYTIYSKPKGDELGFLEDDECKCVVIEIPPTHQSLEEVAKRVSAQLHMDNFFELKSIITMTGLHCIRTTSGIHPSLFSSGIMKMSYFFRNQQGDIICFAATSKTKNPDWEYFTFIITHRLLQKKVYGTTTKN